MGSKESTYHDGKRKRKAGGGDRRQAVVLNAVINSSDGHSGLHVQVSAGPFNENYKADMFVLLVISATR